METPALTPALRLISAVAGAAFLAEGTRRGGLAGALLGMGGGGLLAGAFLCRAVVPQEPERDIVQIASEESFPASDSPAW